MREDRIWSPSAVGPVTSRRLRLFALNGTDKLGRDIGNLLGLPLSTQLKTGMYSGVIGPSEKGGRFAFGRYN